MTQLQTFLHLRHWHTRVTCPFPRIIAQRVFLEGHRREVRQLSKGLLQRKSAAIPGRGVLFDVN